MSSSIFSFKVESGNWRGMLVWLGGAMALVPATVLAGLVLIDPYDSGRFGSVLGPGVPSQGPRTAHASRIRDEAFNAAVIGNSHVQLLSPERLSSLTGLSFVSLTAPGTGVAEQTALLERFVAERGDAVRAVVIGVDAATCRTGPLPARPAPFPFWLYAPRRVDYILGLYRLDAAEAAIRRLGVLIVGGARARRDGWWDYEEDRIAPAANVLAALGPQPLALAEGPFPDVERLRQSVGALPARIAVVLLVPPVYAPLLPPPGTPGSRAGAACIDALRLFKETHPRLVLRDERRDTSLTRSPASFLDATHYRAAVARDLERVVAEALAALGNVP